MKPFYTFTGRDGSFIVNHANQFNYTYFPLVGNGGIRSSITPSFHGDTKIDQNSFLLLPVSQEDLHASLLSRNLWFTVDNHAYPMLDLGQQPDVQTTVQGQFLSHKLEKSFSDFSVAITSFIPYDNPVVELHKVVYTNTSQTTQTMQFMTAIPIYGRSAESIRDHRHVTALLNQVHVLEDGIVNQPTMTFDERGHQRNHRAYGVFAYHQNATITHRHPVMEEFVGDGNTLLHPGALKHPDASNYDVGSRVDGYEAIGGLTFESLSVKPQESTTFIVALTIGDTLEKVRQYGAQYHTEEAFDNALKASNQTWQKELDQLQFTMRDTDYANWLKWVTIQPILRRLFGNSYLPHHDYGKGGRGWRDLWQDALTLLFLDPHGVEDMLYKNYAGVRIDGSNATIIGDTDGEFKSDRNHIVRVWMDHGVWPFLTTKLFIERSGNSDILFEKQRYFHDQHTHYTRKITPQQDDREILFTANNDIYEGTILEHILIQNLVPFYNVDSHNIMRLENADWNDGLDMAPDHGESVAFTAMYQKNMSDIADLLEALHNRGLRTITIAKEVVYLFDTLSTPVNYENVESKQALLHRYFDSVMTNVSGEQVDVEVTAVIQDLRKKADFITSLLRKQEWHEQDSLGLYNGYYDNDGMKLESLQEPVRMTLTGQVFTIMSRVATDDQIPKILAAADIYLYDKHRGGYALNNDFDEVKTNLGRMFGFAYGHKENGAVFSHMAVMFANALYQRGFVKHGRKAMMSLYEQVQDSTRSKMYPGLPEYFDIKGRGMYSYLTGSASWYLYTLVTEVFGIQGYFGDMVLQPKLSQEDWVDGKASITTLFNDRMITINYHNPDDLDYGEYTISSIQINGEEYPFDTHQNNPLIPRDKLSKSATIDGYLTR
ncbi:GH36-type glycosyl hydrolase domain-containing protein [Candidatus Xianfuyuplasma coldseepsis]|uniref:Cellobiose phosphorylase n=1 Tax=Candidatus Xianfuyuplasma coldseepsis TaxID=2782163 RepID=A0A7L7KNU5_9MOLU|nr:cellobiose phosphorylase [Xianfuyuplasma coldseepsis]QMS84440.1 cellobiose phosphorylase [Xianfuyuplasma coldseepsis]